MTDDADAADDLPDEPLADLAADVRDKVDDGDSDSGDPDTGISPPADDTTEQRRDEPLGDLAAEVGRRRDQSDDADLSDLFTSQEVANLDVDTVWEQVESGGLSVDPDEIATDERVVESAGYCEQCEYFSEPPDVACGHEGTDIVEMVDTAHFRVRNCPKVAEDERLGDL